MKKRAVVLGCGLVGATMAKELSRDNDFAVTVADVSDDSLRKVHDHPAIAPLRADLGNSDAVAKLVKDFDVVLGALPSRIGFQTLQTIARSGKPYCDISFMPEDATDADALAKQHGAVAVVDCGVSPGLSNLMVGVAAVELERVERAVIYVGGLPKARHWPFQYKAPFAPSDVIEEYTRPARMVEGGRVVAKPALSEPELIEFPRIGSLEAFNTDGLRSLLKTVPADDMREKTLRYPGHCELMRAMRETGLFRTDSIDVKGTQVRPLDVTSRLLFPLWTYAPGEEEFTVLRVVAEGPRSGRKTRFRFDLYDEYDRATGASSMARTTGFPCVIVAKMLARGQFTTPGVHPPEALARKEGVFAQIVEELAQRGVKIQQSVEAVAA